MRDAAGDGWNGAMVSLTQCNGTEVTRLTLASGFSKIIRLCLPEEGIMVLTEGNRPEEVSLVLIHNGEEEEVRPPTTMNSCRAPTEAPPVVGPPGPPGNPGTPGQPGPPGPPGPAQCGEWT